MVQREDCIQVGEIGKTFDLQGAVVVYVKNDLLERYREKPVFLFLEEAPVPFFIAEDGLTFRNQSSYVVKFDYVDSKEQADRLVGKALLLEKRFVESEDEEGESKAFELEKLIGYSVVDSLTHETGEVVDVANYSGNVVFSIYIFGKEILLPFSDLYVKEISFEEQVICVNIPEEIKTLY